MKPIIFFPILALIVGAFTVYILQAAYDDWKIDHIHKTTPFFNQEPKGEVYWGDSASKWKIGGYNPTVFSDIDSGIRYEEPIRYFFISYEVQEKEKDNTHNVHGNWWGFRRGAFFNFKDVSDYVFACLPMKRECYQNVIITDWTEFKDKADYDNFTAN